MKFAIGRRTYITTLTGPYPWSILFLPGVEFRSLGDECSRRSSRNNDVFTFNLGCLLLLAVWNIPSFQIFQGCIPSCPLYPSTLVRSNLSWPRHRRTGIFRQGGAVTFLPGNITLCPNAKKKKKNLNKRKDNKRQAMILASNQTVPIPEVDF